MADNSMMTALAAALLTCAAPAVAQDFPDGPGKETVVAACGGCHDINRLKVGYTPDGWRKVMRMMENMEVPVPKDQWATVTDYLIKFLPERARPPAVIVAGPVEATVKVWPVPTPGSRPHDPLATRDGALWWTGQLSNRLGKLDPKTGEMKEFTLKSRHTGPHGLTEDKQGNIWFTGNNTALIGKFDPKTGATTEYPLPDPAAKDPHTLIFDNTGILWFTVQQANMLGRLDPATGAIKLVTSPTPKSRPYGMALNSKNVVFFVDFGVNKIGSIDASDDADQGVRPAQCRRPAAAHRDLARRHDLVHGFQPRLPRPPRSGDGRGQGMALAQRAEVGALCGRVYEGRSLVHGDGGQAEHGRPL